MNKLKGLNTHFKKGLSKLGFNKNQEFLFFTDQINLSDPEVRFHVEKAKEFEASAVFLRKQLNGIYKPQVYIYDLTDEDLESEIVLSEIQKKLWTSGEVPLACIFYKTEIKILDCTTHLDKNYKPEYLINHLKTTGRTHEIFNEQFALRIKSGVFWEEPKFEKKFQFRNSSYDKLISNIRYIVNLLNREYSNVSKQLINKLIIQSILIKYLEERIDVDGNRLLSDKYFAKYGESLSFNDVLRKGKFSDLLTDLNDAKSGFNGNIFNWSKKEKRIISELNLDILADLLETKKTELVSDQTELFDWRYFEFKYIPVELISRLYEEFLGQNKRDEGLYYTPSHLAKLLVNESISLNDYKNIDLLNFKVLDPACGSGIFLVLAFKRLVQIWRLQNDMKSPPLKVLKKLLRCIYGVDKEGQAVRLASFSLCLALCNELKPIVIINELKFDDLEKTGNLLQTDFFVSHPIKKKKFDLIIGNPPFNRGALDNYSNYWQEKNFNVKIPQGQIALKFLTDSIPLLKPEGLLCLIIKSSGLLYNTSSTEFKKALFKTYNVIQLFDFTALARNKTLWDNGADVASAAIFLKNQKPNFDKNILHLTFRRTKATKDRIIFEIDEYDLHYVNRISAIHQFFIWKNNLLGGGRINQVVEKLIQYESLEQYLIKNDCSANEGFIVGSKGNKSPDFIFELPNLPTTAIDENNIDLEKLTTLDASLKFQKIPRRDFFEGPNVLIWENIGKNSLPVFYNEKAFSFRDKIVSIISEKKDRKILKNIHQSLRELSAFFRFFIFATSSQVLINKNTAILKKDILNLPFVQHSESEEFTEFDHKIVHDVNEYMQDYLRYGERSKAVEKIKKRDIKKIVGNYGNQFSKILNIVYQDQDKRFRLKNIFDINNSFIATVFSYDNQKNKAEVIDIENNLELERLIDFEISNSLASTRVLKIYPHKNTIVFVKPNQYKYWLSLTAYRDADKCFSDLTKIV